jgi:polysaccharide deacetylase family protein (PEP-CTERM system associated)
MKTENVEITNALTIDVEDWHHNIVEDYNQWSDYEDRIVFSTNKVLNMLEEAGVTATFFIMGYIADHHPELVAQVHAAGHDIQCHGYYHRFVYHLTPEEFREDVCRTRQSLETITSVRPIGYRAPYFSITQKSWWALDILADLGFRYDSSIFPVHNHRYGIPDSPRFAYRIRTNNHKALTELPSSTLKRGINWPVAGGIYFRFLPYLLMKKAVEQINSEGKPAILYVHPWEMDPDQPVLSGLNPLFKARRYLNLGKTENKWRSLLSDFKFAPMSEVFRREINGDFDD